MTMPSSTRPLAGASSPAAGAAADRPRRRVPASPQGLGQRLRLLLAGASSLALAACAVTPEPLTTEEVRARAEADLAVAFAAQEPVSGPLTLHDAMARAVLYNLDRRVRVKEEALAQAQLDLARFDMLPQVVASAGYVGRDKVSASRSLSVTTGAESLETSTSLENDRRVADLTFAWNILDFGVSYYGAKQQANRALIATERRRRVVHEIIQDVRVAYWRAIAAERLMRQIDPVMARVQSALDRAFAEERQRLRAPLEALTYQRELLDTLRQLEDLRTGLAVARTELAALINLPLDQPLELAAPTEAVMALPEIGRPAQELARIALLNRPELRAEDYQTRIAEDEVHRAFLRFLPGIELESALNFDSNDFLLHNDWIDYSARISWNLLGLISAPTALERAEAEVDLATARRHAIGVAVLSQTYVSLAALEEAGGQHERAVRIAELERRILRQVGDRYRAGQIGELAVIQAEVKVLVADLRQDLAMARQQNAAGQVLVAIGADPMPDMVSADDLATVTEAIGTRQRRWIEGDLAGLVATPAGTAPGSQAME